MTEKNPRARVSLAFLQEKDTDVHVGGKRVVAGMTGNPEFTNPPVKLAELDALLDSYNDAITACLDGGRLATATRNSLREAVTKALRRLAAYVESVANGDETIIRSSGFDSWTYQRSQPQPLETPAPAKLQQGSSGEFYVAVTRLEDAKNYELRYGVAGTDPGTWSSQDVTRVRPATLISGLTPGVIYTVQVRALGHMGWTDWSDPISKMVI